MMNKKIQKLFEQAGGYIKVDHEGNEWTYTQDLDAEFFAKLVIAECVDIGYKSSQYEFASSINDYFREG